MEKEEFTRIANKIIEGTATEKEMSLYLAFYNQHQAQYPEWNLVKEYVKQETEVQLLKRVHARMDVQRPKDRKLWPYIAVAASLLLAILAGILYLKPAPDTSRTARYKNDVDPGTQTAVLIMGNGKRINLNASTNGKIAEETGIIVTKTSSGQLVYQIKPGENNKIPVSYNTIETPRGGEYQLSLPDGTVIWLNASTSLKYPTQFVGGERRVQLSGEAYFQVAKNKSRPFIVHTNKQDVKVLGTHFNVSSYADEELTKTTLLEGSVKVIELQNLKERLLVPGQQSILKASVLQVVAVDPEVAVAWKNGLFMFDKENLQTIMRQLSRWYNIEVVYEDGIDRNQVFAGSISKFKKVSQALEILELTKTVKFKIEGRRITVMQ